MTNDEAALLDLLLEIKDMRDRGAVSPQLEAEIQVWLGKVANALAKRDHSYDSRTRLAYS